MVCADTPSSEYDVLLAEQPHRDIFRRIEELRRASRAYLERVLG
jgi:hypothetical protein